MHQWLLWGWNFCKCWLSKAIRPGSEKDLFFIKSMIGRKFSDLRTNHPLRKGLWGFLCDWLHTVVEIYRVFAIFKTNYRLWAGLWISHYDWGCESIKNKGYLLVFIKDPFINGLEFLFLLPAMHRSLKIIILNFEGAKLYSVQKGSKMSDLENDILFGIEWEKRLKGPNYHFGVFCCESPLLSFTTKRRFSSLLKLVI